ncbi:MAG: ribosome-associated translation inhibitor RaiA [Flavobacteriales bacterium]|nr:ribosome-associated translation inhibitor RaiA [Flavobacteriales bacterium]
MKENINIHSIHFDADKKLVDFIEKKVSKLERYYDAIISREVFLRLDNSQDNNNKIAEIKLSIPGKDFFAKRQCKSFEEATDTAIEALRRQILKHKGKAFA